MFYQYLSIRERPPGHYIIYIYTTLFFRHMFYMENELCVHIEKLTGGGKSTLITQNSVE